MKIIDNEVHGTTYYTAGRYGYNAIDKTYGNTSGCCDVMSGIKPKKLAIEICKAISKEQNDAMSSLLLASMIGESANSEELYLYSTNHCKLYDLYFKPSILKLKKILVEEKLDLWAWGNLITQARAGFEAGIECYEIEFPKHKQESWYNFTSLDVFICVKKWVEFYRGEFAVNKLEGYDE